MRITLVAVALSLSPLTAQIPQGHYVFSTFGATGDRGVFHAHPRSAGQPTPITGLAGDLVITDGASIFHRVSDGAVLVGERSPIGASVDLHVIELGGDRVLRDASFSVGTGGSCCGEIPQFGLLPDGRVVIAATDIAAGPLSMYLTTSYGYQGVGILDTVSGLVTPVPITNGAAIVDVFNGMAIAPDASAVYLGCWGANQGQIWHLPLPAGGTATLVATLPVGLSNMAFDGSGTLWCTTLDPMRPLFRVDVGAGSFTAVTTGAGALNAIDLETVTGNFGLVSSSQGTPGKSIFWLEPNGNEHPLSSPGLATPSGISVHANPAQFGDPAAHDWHWSLAPNAGGLPLVGNGAFSLTVRESSPQLPTLAIAMLATGRRAQPLMLLGAEILLDANRLLHSTVIAPLPSVTIPLGIPNNPALAGVALYLQTLHMDGNGTLTSSRGVAMTIL